MIIILMVLLFLMLVILFCGIENFKMFDFVVQFIGGGFGLIIEFMFINLKCEVFEKWCMGYVFVYVIILFVIVFGFVLIYVKVLNKVKE